MNAGSLPSAGLAEGAEPPPIPLRIKVGEGSVREVRFDRRTTRFPALSRAVRAHRTRLVGCFDAALEHAPFLNGWLTIRVQLGDDPSTLRPEVEENALIVGTMRVGTAKPPEPGVTEKWRLFSNARFGNVPRRVIPTLEQCLVGVVESITLAEPTTPVESTVIRFSRGPSAP